LNAPISNENELHDKTNLSGLIFLNIQSPFGSLTEYAIRFWKNGSGNTIKQNGVFILQNNGFQV
jgi:hypothetical protein